MSKGCTLRRAGGSTSELKGYWDDYDKTNEVLTESGWMKTGDLAIIDDSGYGNIVGRVKDMIIRGGANVYPREIEEVIIKHPKVSLVAVVGIPDKRMGEEIKAYVILNQDQKISKSEFKNWIKTKVAANKYPRQIEFVNELPLNATGKILKRKLKFKEH